VPRKYLFNFIGLQKKPFNGVDIFRLEVSSRTTAKEGPVRIQYKCLVPIYVFPEMELLFLIQNYNVLCPSNYTHICVRDLYISRIGLPILLQGNMWTDPWEYMNRSLTHEC
jgi:hypothetical protein